MYDKILKLHKIDFVPEASTLSYLDYYYEGRAGEDEYKVIGLRAYQKMYTRIDTVVPVSETQDSGVELKRHLFSEIFHEMLTLSTKSKEEVQKKFPDSIDLYRGDLDDEAFRRRITSRILMAANLVASRSRRGPANFVIISSDLLPFILNKKVGIICGLDHVFSISYLAPDMSVLVSDEITKKIVLGRRPSVDDDPGMHMFITEEDLVGNRLESDETGITGVNISYILAACGNAPESNYMEFDVYI